MHIEVHAPVVLLIASPYMAKALLVFLRKLLAGKDKLLTGTTKR